MDNPIPLHTALRRELLRLAAHLDDLAADEAARTPYWAPCPDSVAGHREAARVLRAGADRYPPPGVATAS